MTCPATSREWMDFTAAITCQHSEDSNVLNWLSNDSTGKTINSFWSPRSLCNKQNTNRTSTKNPNPHYSHSTSIKRMKFGFLWEHYSTVAKVVSPPRAKVSSGTAWVSNHLCCYLRTISKRKPVSFWEHINQAPRGSWRSSKQMQRLRNIFSTQNIVTTYSLCGHSEIQEKRWCSPERLKQ